MPGFFIVLEGPDGAGTTLHSRLLAERLKKEDHDALLTAEPTDGPIGKWIRKKLKEGNSFSPSALQMMFCADRAWHVDTVIKPALAEGKTVISDRYAASTIMYGTAQGIDPTWLQTINEPFPQPTISLFLLPPFEVCMERIGWRSERDFFEQEEMQRKIYKGYVQYAQAHASITVIDSSKAKEDTSNDIYRTVTLFSDTA